jgi:hypothetical protein
MIRELIRPKGSWAEPGHPTDTARQINGRSLRSGRPEPIHIYEYIAARKSSAPTADTSADRQALAEYVDGQPEHADEQRKRVDTMREDVDAFRERIRTETHR